MEMIDWIELILGLVWGTVVLILWRQNRSNPNRWPRIFGMGGGTFMLVLSMTRTILLRPISEFVKYTIPNILLSLAMGAICYISGRELARRFPNLKDYNHERKRGTNG